MGISDLSSDVCSPDLTRGGGPGCRGDIAPKEDPAIQKPAKRNAAQVCARKKHHFSAGQEKRRGAVELSRLVDTGAAQGLSAAMEGSARCREPPGPHDLARQCALFVGRVSARRSTRLNSSH